jgi:DNA-binding HxlR family transcriptional regulator
MRSYRQYCSVARALDVVGDRWSLLIVRELLLQGPCRYTDLQVGLPGIATNLLADRLRELEAAGVISREDAPPPIATTLFRLTRRGEALRPLIDDLGRWGLRFMDGGPKGDAFRSHWLGMPAQLGLTDRHPNRAPVTIEIRTGEEESMYIETADGGIRTHRGAAEDPDLVLTGSPEVLGSLLTGYTGLAEARRQGLKMQGDAKVLDRVRPQTKVSLTG